MWIFLFFNWIFFWYVMSSKVLKSILFTWTYQTRDTFTNTKNLFVEKCFLFFFEIFWNFFEKFLQFILPISLQISLQKKIEIFEKIKKKFEFSEVSSNFCVFLWKFRFSKNFLVFAKHGGNAWRTETFCKKSTEKGLFKKVVKSCLRILLTKLWHRWKGKKCAKMKKNMIFYSVFPRKKKGLKCLKNAQKCSKMTSLLTYFLIKLTYGTSYFPILF